MGLFSKPRPPAPDTSIQHLELHVSEAELRYLDVLRREIANQIIEADPAAMQGAYSRAWQYERDVTDPNRLAADEAALVARFRQYGDFELLGIRHCIPYSEATRDLCPDQLVERYLEICRMMVLLRLGNEAKHSPLFTEQESETLRREVRRVTDGRDIRRIDDAMRVYLAFRRGVQQVTENLFAECDYQDATVEVGRIDREAYGDIWYGIHFRETGENCVYAFSVGDGPKTTSYYRTNAAFGDRTMLSSM